jgi:exosortase
MLPLPYFLEVSLAHRLQRLATLASTYGLQTLGLAAIAEGNVIIMSEARIGVVEACSGLGMLVTFFAEATAVAMLIRRSILEKLLIVASAVPIALTVNVIRIMVTGIVAETAGESAADRVHDLAGWFLMPTLALALLWLELAILSRLLIDAPHRQETIGTLPELIEPSGCLATSN